MDDFYETSYVKKGRNGRKPRLCVTYHDAGGGRHERTRSAKSKRLSALRREAEEWRAELNDEWRARLAEEEAARRREDREAGVPMLGDYIRYYVRDRRAGGIQASSVVTYERLATYILDPDGGLSDLKLSQITVEGCRAWVRHLVGERELSAVTVSKALGLLRAVLRRAVDDEIIESNPAAKVRGPRVPRPNPNALDRQSVSRLRGWVDEDGDWFRTAVAIALFTGMRSGEICALRWRDVDWERSVIHLRNSIGRSGTGTYIKCPKNGKPRDVGIPDDLMRSLLRRHGGVMATLVNLYDAEEAKRRVPDLFVCGEPDGSWRDPHLVTARWDKLRVELGIRGFQRERCPFHDIRHTFITYLVQAGVPVTQIMKVVGHSSAAMTLDVYASVDPELLVMTSRAVGSALPSGEWEEGEPAYVLPAATE